MRLECRNLWATPNTRSCFPAPLAELYQMSLGLVEVNWIVDHFKAELLSCLDLPTSPGNLLGH